MSEFPLPTSTRPSSYHVLSSKKVLVTFSFVELCCVRLKYGRRNIELPGWSQDGFRQFFKKVEKFTEDAKSPVILEFGWVYRFTLAAISRPTDWVALFMALNGCGALCKRIARAMDTRPDSSCCVQGLVIVA